MKLYEHQKNVPVKGFEGLYEVDENGKVFSFKTNRYLKPSSHKGRRGDLYYTLRKDGKSYKKLLSRIVAEAFLDNPLNLPQVNHIDGNYLNNNISNLEWIDNRSNTIHAYKNHLRKNKVIWIYDGVDYVPLRTVCVRLGLVYKKVHTRLKYLGWDLEKALEYKGGDSYVMCKTLPLPK